MIWRIERVILTYYILFPESTLAFVKEMAEEFGSEFEIFIRE